MAGLAPSACRAAIKALLETVANVGKVYDFRRRFTDEKSVQTLAMAEISSRKVVRVWMISPSLSNAAVVTGNPGHRGIGQQSTQTQDMGTFQFQIEGYLGVEDGQESEKVATDLAWTIAELFNSYAVIPSLSGAHFQGRMSIEEFKFAVLAGTYLCHYVRMEVSFMGRIRT